MKPKSKNLRAFVSSCEIKKKDAKPALVPKLRFPALREKTILHTKARSHEEEEQKS